MPRKKTETAEETLREHFPPIGEAHPAAPILVQGTAEAARICDTCAAYKPTRMHASMGTCKLNPIPVNKGKTDYCLQWAARPEASEPAPVAGEESAA